MKTVKTIGIVFAMKEELLVMLQHLSHTERLILNHFTVTRALFFQKKLFLIDSGIGKVNAAIATALLIQKYQPDLIINVGIAGSVTNELEVGDVVLSNTSVYYDVDVTAFGYQYGQVPKMPQYYQSELFSFKHNINFDFKVLSGLVCTGDSFLTSQDRLKEIRRFFTHIFAIDMEAAAVAQTCHQFKTPFLIIKGISDKVDNASIKDSEDNITLAMNNALQVLKVILDFKETLNSVESLDCGKN